MLIEVGYITCKVHVLNMAVHTCNYLLCDTVTWASNFTGVWLTLHCDFMTRQPFSMDFLPVNTSVGVVFVSSRLFLVPYFTQGIVNSSAGVVTVSSRRDARKNGRWPTIIYSSALPFIRSISTQKTYNTRWGARRGRTSGGREETTGSHPICKWC